MQRAKVVLGASVTCSLLTLLLIPWRPSFPGSGLDPSWRSVIAWGLLEGRQFGVDLVFTFGPLGFLYTNEYHPSLFAFQLAFWASVAVLIGVFFSAYWARSPLPVSFALAMILVLAVGYVPDPWLLFIPFAAAIEAIDPVARGRRWLLYMLVGLSVVEGLVKSTFLIAAAALLVVADAVRLVQHRVVPHLSVLLVAGSWALFLWITGHASWPAFVLSSLEAADGYSAAMQKDGPGHEVIRSIVVGLLVLGVLGLSPSHGRGKRCLVTRSGVVVVTAITAFLMFKAGVVRHDGHIAITAAGLLLLSALAAWRAFSQGGDLGIRTAAVAAVVVAGYNLLAVPALHFNGPPPARSLENLLIQRPKAALGDATAFVGGGAGRGFRQERLRALAAIRARNPLPGLGGTVDIYSYDQADVLANVLDYSPRPVFQSYAAYTPRLIKRNAEFLAGPAAPDFILFAPQTIDRRLPALEDGLSWPLLWSRYDAVSLLGWHVLLARRKQSDRPIAWGKTTTSTVGWGEPAVLSETPEGAPCVWAAVEIQSTVWGRLLSTVFKPPQVEIELGLADGRTVRRRFVPGMGRTGFLLSPYVDAVSDFVHACAGGARPATRRVERLSFRVRGEATPFFKSDVVVRTRPLGIGL